MKTVIVPASEVAAILGRALHPHERLFVRHCILGGLVNPYDIIAAARAKGVIA